jgi:hypothetical protein
MLTHNVTEPDYRMDNSTTKLHKLAVNKLLTCNTSYTYLMYYSYMYYIYVYVLYVCICILIRIFLTP